MIKTTYTCDLCGAEQDTHEQIWLVSVKYRALYFQHSESTAKEAHWCRACMVKAHIIGSAEEKVKVSAPEVPPTIEELIRNVVREEIERSSD